MHYWKMTITFLSELMEKIIFKEGGSRIDV